MKKVKRGTAVVTGCAGFIGSHLAEQLLQEGYSVIGVDNFESGNEENMSSFISNKDFRFLEMDINDPELITRIKEDVDTVYHLAAIASVKLSTEDPQLVHHVNVDGTLAILELARKRNASRIVLSSSAAVYGNPETQPISENQLLDPLSPYAASKIAAEAYVHSYGHSFGIESVVLRYFNVYGPRQESSEYSGVIAIFAGNATKGLPLLIDGDGKQTRSFIFVGDVVEATIAAGTTPKAVGATINVSGKNSITILEIANTVRNTVSSHSVEIQHGPPRIGDIRDSLGATDLAKELLGVSASTTLDEGLRKTLSWYQE